VGLVPFCFHFPLPMTAHNREDVQILSDEQRLSFRDISVRQKVDGRVCSRTVCRMGYWEMEPDHGEEASWCPLLMCDF